MVAVPPPVPVTVPVAFTVAMVASLLVHTPPAAVSVSISVLPAHMVPAPLMAPAVGALPTVSLCVTVVVQPYMLLRL